MMMHGIRVMTNAQLEGYRLHAIQMGSLQTSFAIHREQLRRFYGDEWAGNFLHNCIKPEDLKYA